MAAAVPDPHSTAAAAAAAVPVPPPLIPPGDGGLSAVIHVAAAAAQGAGTAAQAVCPDIRRSTLTGSPVRSRSGQLHGCAVLG